MPTASAAEPVVAAVDYSATRTTPSGDLVFAWHRVAGATGYDLQVASDSSFSTLVASTSTAATRWVAPSALWAADSRQLFWRVAPKGVGADISGATVQAFSRSQAPTPELLAPADGTTITYPSPVTLSWEVTPGATEYTVTYRPTSGGNATSAKIAGTAYTLPALKEAGEYTWNVKAHFPASAPQPAVESYPSASRTFRASWGAASVPQLVQPADRSVANDLEFAWSEVDGAKEYKFELSSDISFGSSSIKLTSIVSGTSFVPTDVLALGTYHWRVTPIDASGTPGETSTSFQVQKVSSTDEGSATTTATPAIPEFIGLSSTVAGAPTLDFDSFQLRWTAVPRATYYRVEVDRSGGGKMACTTASTSATIVSQATAVGNAKASLTSSTPCLFTSTEADRIKPASAEDLAAGTAPIYIAKVFAVNMSASSTKDYKDSDPKHDDVVPSSLESKPHYFRVGNSGTATATADAITPDSPAQTATMESSPYLTWPASSLPGVVGYIVNVYTEGVGSSLVAELRVPTNALRTTGVFKPNRTDASTDSYNVTIAPASGSPTSPSQWTELVGDVVEKETISWRRSLPPTEAGTVVQQGNVPVLRLKPNPATQFGGSSRGYAVRIYPEGSNNAVTTLKVDQPSTVAAKSFSTSGTTFTATPLASGRYTFTWAPLDAVGNEAEHSAPTSFAIGSNAPTGLSRTTRPGGTSATLTWSYPVTAKGYDVEVTQVGSSATSKFTTASRGVTVEGLVPGRSYSWRVRARDVADNLGAWAAGTAFTAPNLAATPRTVNVTDASSAAPVLTWDPVPGASRYLVKISRAGQSTMSTVETSALSHVPTVALAYGTGYFYEVQAIGSGTASTALLGTVQTGNLSVVTLPSAPTTPSTTVNGTSITASWNALVAPATGSAQVPTYTLQYRSKPAGVSADGWVDAGTGVNLTSYTVTGLAQGTVYQFRVRASNSEGVSAWSGTREQTTVAQPGPITRLTATPGLGSLRLTWSAPATTSTAGRANDYVVEFTTGGAWTRVVVPGTSVTLDRLAPGRAYSVQVAARNAAGTSQMVGLSAVTLAAPGTPRAVKAKRGNTTATVTWAAPSSNGGSSITSYTVESRSYAGKKWSAWAVRGATSGATSWVAGGLVNGTAYEFRVIARTALGLSAPSAAAAVTPAGKPLAPTVKAKSSKKRAVTVSWKAAPTNGSKVTKYVVQYSTNGKKWKTVKTTSASARSYTWKKGKSKKLYYFRVYAVNSLGSGVKSVSANALVK
ncbi:hypothetical protein HF995_08765 [Sanguibacter hominis ATCC BAA-789]|uniref:Fibronectin type-III domain-containing protein n=1 Tax=Sanguibacter hominis ATCC BAA-789 TaxID=1312740 RepID=A0A9X5FDU6_9MICO|nr:fibronectin type III domain-containing protein [Sanguibacter hominis]NKX93357.1 hypothetical protein [Sanguibacter hominis ATCC BAA-789]